ncbi:MAG: serine/threonine protein kinase [Polyangiaceae bacterium]|nr:serine/threonine protein kinase [Polyangiaceae bacterium]
MPPKDPFIGQDILGGQFRIIEKIGTGGMGSVYRAEQPAMERTVAIKILHPKLAGRSDLVTRFRREARAMSQLTHPNTVRVFMYGELTESRSLYIVMEILDGRNLNRAVKREGPLPVPQAVAILIQVAGALQEAHDKGIVHRDLKPENIFLARQGEVNDYPKVLDFGLAKVSDSSMRPGSVQLTQEGMVFGTPEFMSPEQAQGKILDARSDIYSLAVILYEALTKKLPFDARTPMEYIQKHVAEAPILLNQRVEGMCFPPGLEAVLQRGMAKNKDQRYQSSIEFAAALREFAGDRIGALDAIFQISPSPNSMAPGPSSVDGRAVARPAPRAGPLTALGKPPSTALLVAVAASCLVAGIAIAMAAMHFMGK